MFYLFSLHFVIQKGRRIAPLKKSSAIALLGSLSLVQRFDDPHRPTSSTWNHQLDQGKTKKTACWSKDHQKKRKTAARSVFLPHGLLYHQAHIHEQQSWKFKLRVPRIFK
jgi:hypothetical protein